MPRPTVYNPGAHQRIVDALRAGSSMRDAVGFAGVRWMTFLDWLRAGRRHIDGVKEGADERYAQLAADVDQAAHESSVALIGILRRAAEGNAKTPGDWRAGEALLKHRRDAVTHRYATRKLRLENDYLRARIAGTLPAEKHEHLVGTDDELGRRLARLVAAESPGGGSGEPDGGGT
jgi:hypothetical protein